MMSWVAGADGFKSKWCVVLWHLDTGELRGRIASAFSELLELPERPLAVGVDIPIGLPEFTPPGGRGCERDARRVLGRKASCVFSAVGRSALTCPSRAEADRCSREAGGIGIGAQAWGLSAKLKEADAAMTSERQKAIYEVHPELSFWALNGSVPMTHGKKTDRGAEERIEALVRGGFLRENVQTPPAGLRVGRDDFLDACAAAWTARRAARGRASRFPVTIERDARGLDMAIWF